MEDKLTNLQPRIFWENFAAICQIPHVSKQEAKLCAYIKDFAERLGLKTLVDDAGNLIVKKPASSGMENCQGVILQAHLDMVGQKDKETAHDFSKDPIQAYVDGEWVRAKGTTLGADDGVGVAAIMAVLQDNTLKHGPIEALLTVDEETGLTGAYGLKAGLLDGKILLNLDSELEGEVIIGSAGGVFVDGEFSFKKISAPKDSQFFTIKVSGLEGGHSAVAIDKQMSNALKILGRILSLAKKEFEINLVSFDGGNAYNAIPREAQAEVAVAPSQVAKLKEFAESHRKFLVGQFAELNTLKIEIAAIDNKAGQVMEQQDQMKLLDFISICPHGVIGMSKVIPDLIETSTNLAIVKTDTSTIKISAFPRSAIEFFVDDVANSIASLLRAIGAQAKLSDKFPSWQPNPENLIAKLASEVYAKKFGKKLKIAATHAGLECGIFLQPYPELQIISFGPTMENVHSPSERVNIKSCANFWEFLVSILESVPGK